MANLTQLKFKPNGEFNAFSGNTVVANLYDQPEILQAVAVLQDRYRQLPFSNKFTLTPPESIHMTVFELLCDQNREEAFWSKFLPLNLPIAEVSAYFGDKLSHFPLTEEQITMRVTGLGTLTILLEPADAASRERLANIREFISHQTGVIFPNHNSYQFHITIGYRHQELTQEEQAYLDNCRQEAEKLLLERLQEVKINRIDYTTFEDMSRFLPYGGLA